ncbi:hypothetical protein M1M07_12180 [Rhodococcus sp. HM1]|uniref:hypothetical protein n=1 Tax=Rhodococcus sp. HM1 TaxID=2937759 RepID=UPI00200B72EC|nr:hypothetical protein [Rhodococcus sp. HM1]MCK8671872.1 hypothetical protein [Rhodococcus sp. HM1]
MAVRTALLDRSSTVPADRRDRVRLVLGVGFALVVVQVAIRAAVAAVGELYWDDLILIGRAGTYPLWSAELLLHDHDGHLMPGAFAAAALADAVAPLQWWPAAVSLVVGQAVASLAVLRVLWLLLGPRRVLWGPLLFYLFAPLTLPAFAWWAAGLNALPLQAALAWVAGDALLLARTGRRRYAVSATVVTAIALLFFEKSILVPFVAFATVALAYRVDGRARPVRLAARRGRVLWIASAALLTGWAACYLTFVESRFGIPDLAMVSGLTHHGLSYGLVPTLLGGPWQWERWNPSPPWATPPIVLVVVSWAAVIAVLVWSVRRRRRTGWVWAAAAAYVLASLAAMISTRFGAETTYELAQTLRYFADSAVIGAIAAALALRAPARGAPARISPVVAAICAVAFTAGSLWSTVTFTRSWVDNPTGDYLATARVALTAHPDVPILDHPVSVWVLLPVTHPHNLIGSVFSALPGRAEIADSAEDPAVLDDSGALVEGALFAVRWVPPGPEPDCGYLLSPGTTVALPLDGPMMELDWTVQLNYFASQPGRIEVGFPGADPTQVPVGSGPGTVYVRVPGGGNGLQVRSPATGPTVCFGGGPVGVITPK